MAQLRLSVENSGGNSGGNSGVTTELRVFELHPRSEGPMNTTDAQAPVHVAIHSQDVVVLTD